MKALSNRALLQEFEIALLRNAEYHQWENRRFIRQWEHTVDKWRKRVLSRMRKSARGLR